MLNYKKVFLRDKYGVIRGSLILGVLVILCALVSLRLMHNYEVEAEESRASEAVNSVAARFEQLIDSGFGQMRGIATLLEGEQCSESALLDSLRTNDLFCDAGIYANGKLRGTKEVAVDGNKVSYIHYNSIASVSKVIAQTDGAIQLRVSMGEKGELATWVDPAKVEEVLKGAFDGEYGYAIYNDATGAYLVNRTLFSDGGYYDSLLSMNEDGMMEVLLSNEKAHVRIKGQDGKETYYIAQQESGIQPWSIALVIPESLVQTQHQNGRVMLVAALAALMLVVLLICTLFTLHRIRNINDNARRAIEVGERMLISAVQQARMSIFVYYRGSDAPILCYDGLNLVGEEGGLNLASLSSIEAGCGMNEDSKESFEEHLHDLAVGGTAEFIVHSEVADREERVLRFMLAAPADDESSIICSIWDCTQELISQNRAEEERIYRVSVEPKTMAIWQINISRNRWHALHLKPGIPRGALSVVKSVWRDYSSDLSGIFRNYLHSSDYQNYVECMSIDALSDMYRSGKTQFTFDYRAYPEERKDCQWYRVSVRLYLNPDSGDVLANLYVFNVDAEKNAELERGDRKRILQQTLTALGGIYYGLYYVDLENDLCYTVKSQVRELVSQLSVSYKTTFDNYIDQYVHPDDREELRKVLNAYVLRKSMIEGSHSKQMEYRHLMGDEYGWMEAIVQPARFENGSVKDVVLALRKIKGRHMDEKV